MNKPKQLSTHFYPDAKIVTPDLLLDVLKECYGASLETLYESMYKKLEELQIDYFGSSEDLTRHFPLTNIITDGWADTRSIFFLLEGNGREDLPEKFFLSDDSNSSYISTSSDWRYQWTKRFYLIKADVELAGKPLKIKVCVDLSASSPVPEESVNFLRSLPGKVKKETHTYTESSESLSCDLIPF